MTRLFSTKRVAGLITLAYLTLAVAYGLANPPFEATDEIRHFRYIRYLTLNRALPPVSVEASQQLQAHHPPLYYALAALITAPVQSEAGPDYSPPINPFWGFRYYEPSTDNKNQYLHTPDDWWPLSSGGATIVFLARLLSTFFGLGIVLMAYRLARLVFPDDASIALGVMAFTAFNPTLLHSAASINNDAAAAFFGCWAVTEAVAAAYDRTRPWAALRFGLALSLGIMSKVSVGVLAPLALVWLAPSLRPVRFPKPHRSARDLALIVLPLLLITGWWFGRNYLASGDLMGLGDYQSAWQGEADRARLVREAISGLPYAWTTLWARFDYGQIVLPDWAYQLWTVLALAAVAGLVRAGMGLLTPGMFVAACAIGLSLAGWGVLMVTIPATAHARHILYAFPAIGLLLVAGWRNLLPRFEHWTLGFGLWNLGFCLIALFGYLAPAFAYPGIVGQPPADAAPAAANFEDAAEIVGYTISAESIRAGDQLNVTVYWKPLARTAAPLQAFVHLVDGQGIIAAQRDTYPGLGNALTTTWRVGDTFADTYRVFLPETAYAPEALRVRVGLWNPAESRPLIVRDSDAAELGEVVLLPRPGDLPNPISINFGDTAQLISYDLDRRSLAAGDTFQLQTYWRIPARLTSDYWAYAHVVGNDGRIWALADSIILPFTTGWDLAGVNGETRPITLSPDTPPGQYTLEFGLTRVDEAGQYRLPVLAEDGHGLGDHIDLARIRVEAK